MYHRADSLGRNIYMYVDMYVSAYLTTDLLHASIDAYVCVSMDLLHGGIDAYASMFLPHCMAAEMHVQHSLRVQCTLLSQTRPTQSQRKKRPFTTSQPRSCSVKTLARSTGRKEEEEVEAAAVTIVSSANSQSQLP